MSPALSDDADWACRVGERLPGGDVQRLARAAQEGAASVRSLRAAAGSVILRNACDQLWARLDGGDPAYLSGLLAGAARAAERARDHQSLTVVWTGPESGVRSSRLTAATVINLIALAEQEILLVSFATQTEPLTRAALESASARGVSITILAETHADNPSYAASGTPFPSLSALRLHWPASQRPRGAALHAKIIVIDDRAALVGSANLTGRAMDDNLECGILIRGGSEPRLIRDHINGLREAGHLHRLLLDQSVGS